MSGSIGGGPRLAHPAVSFRVTDTYPARRAPATRGGTPSVVRKRARATRRHTSCRLHPIVDLVGPDASAPAVGRRGRRRTADEACGAADTRPIDATTAGLRATHADLQPDQVTDHHVHVAGHLELIRRQGRLTFATLRDSTGSIQLFVDTGLLGADRHHAFDDLERGDRVCCAGTVMTTRRGELSVRVEEFALLPAEVETHPVTVPAEPCADGGSPVPTSVVALPAMAPSTQAINPPDPRPDLHPRAVTAVAALTALCGVLQLLSTIPFVHARFGARDAAIGPLWVPIVGHVVSVIVGLLLILLADQLGRRSTRPGGWRWCCSRSAPSPTCSRGRIRSPWRSASPC